MKISFASLVLFLGLVMIVNARVIAEPVPGGTLDPLTIPKYVTPLVIPPVMNNNGTAETYDIAVRQFKQQILPGGLWNVVNGRTDAFPATTIWSYGPAGDPVPDASALGIPAGIAPAPNSQFNYPAYTMETTSNVRVDVKWINDLTDENNNYLPHLLSVDQTLHWANPTGTGCRNASMTTDCMTYNDSEYTGPVPIVTHVHGAHVDPHSDGYPEAWWLPNALDIPSDYVRSGTFFDDSTGNNNGEMGFADYSYRQDQPATTLWYHDHALGMTRLNVYAGPAGFWLIRGGEYDGAVDGKEGRRAKLPRPAPVAGQGVLELNLPSEKARRKLREIPIVIQDRSFNADGSLFYPDNRAFFEGLNVEGEAEQFPNEPELQIPFVNNVDEDSESDISKIWNPEAFFNVMVVNGVSWPTLEVAPALYRFRLLNGCNSRFLNLSMKRTGNQIDDGFNEEHVISVPFYQIGADQGFLRQVVRVEEGFATALPGDGSDVLPKYPACTKANGTIKGGCVVAEAAPNPEQALLMALAERADVIVDFREMENGDVITMFNTAPDGPFMGFGDGPADPDTTGQVMQFVVNKKLRRKKDKKTTSPQNLVMNFEPSLPVTTLPKRQISLNEGESEKLCVEVDGDGNVVAVAGDPHTGCPAGSEAFAPKEALLGTVDFSGLAPEGISLKWTAPGNHIDNNVMRKVTIQENSSNPTELDVWVTENPDVGAVEDWEIYNFTADAHPIHQHLVRFEVIERRAMDPLSTDPVNPLQPWENGMKDTVIAYPGEVTTIRSRFDVAGLYVWHCHIVEHEDNEMMRPYFVGP